MKSYQLEAERILSTPGVTRKCHGFDCAIAALLLRSLPLAPGAAPPALPPSRQHNEGSPDRQRPPVPQRLAA